MSLQETFSLRLNSTLAIQGEEENLLVSLEVRACNINYCIHYGAGL